MMFTVPGLIQFRVSIVKPVVPSGQEFKNAHFFLLSKMPLWVDQSAVIISVMLCIW